MAPNLYELIIDVRVHIEVLLNNDVSVNLATPTVTPVSAGFKYLDNVRAASVALRAGMDLCRRLTQMPFKGAMYVQDDQMIDVTNEVKSVYVRIDFNTISGELQKAGVGAKFEPGDQSMLQVANVTLALLRRITDSISGGRYERPETDDEQPADDEL